MNTRRVVITGLGAITPIGNNVEEFWNGLIEGKNGAGPITRFDPSEFPTQFACEVKNYDPSDHLDVKTIKRMDLFTQFAMTTCYHGYGRF